MNKGVLLPHGITLQLLAGALILCAALMANVAQGADGWQRVGGISLAYDTHPAAEPFPSSYDWPYSGDNGDGTSDDDAEIDLSTDEGLQAVKDAIDAMASSGTPPDPESIAEKIIQAVSYANNGMDLSTAEGVRRAQQEMLELAAQPDPESQKRHENLALAIIRAASEAANAI